MQFLNYAVPISSFLAIVSTLWLNGVTIMPSVAEATFDINPQYEALSIVIVSPLVTGESESFKASTSTKHLEEPEQATKESPTAPSTSGAVTKTNLKSSHVVSVSSSGLVTKPVVTQPPIDSGEYNFTKVASEVHLLSNSARSKNDLSTLSYDQTLAAKAQSRSEDMARNNYFSHTSKSGCDLACRFKDTSYLVFGENLGEYTEYFSFTEAKLASKFVDMWLRSPSHRANLLSTKFTREGIGVAAKGDRVVVTVMFAAQ